MNEKLARRLGLYQEGVEMKNGKNFPHAQKTQAELKQAEAAKKMAAGAAQVQLKFLYNQLVEILEPHILGKDPVMVGTCLSFLAGNLIGKNVRDQDKAFAYRTLKESIEAGFKTGIMDAARELEGEGDD